MEDNIIKRKREALGYSQSQFAEMSGVNFRTLQDYEQGRKPIPSIKGEVLYRISTSLGCTMEDLLLERYSCGSRSPARLIRYVQLMNRLLDTRHAGKVHTPFDDVFRTLSVDCSSLLIPVVNEIFKVDYDSSALVEQRQNEHFSHGDDGMLKKIISDANFIVLEKNGESRSYQVECQSRMDNSILIRLFEYATATAMEGGQLEGNTLHITYPKSALVYLRHTAQTPDDMEVALETPGGTITWQIPVIKSQTYSVDDIFEKHLYLFIPFYLLTYEKRLSAIEGDKEAICAMKGVYEDIFERLEEAVRQGELNTYQMLAIRNMSKRICDYMTEKYHRINEEVRAVMGGQVLDYEAKQIWRQGNEKGLTQGIAQGTAAAIRNLMKSLSFTEEQAMEALMIPESDYEKYRKLI